LMAESQGRPKRIEWKSSEEDAEGSRVRPRRGVPLEPQRINGGDWYGREFQLRRADDGQKIRVEETALVRRPGPLVEQEG
jgi:hypothetical protein